MLLAPARADDLWVEYTGAEGLGEGGHIVFISGDEEYRSEEALPQLAKILAVHHGFRCTVLFAIDPVDGTINPDVRNNILDRVAQDADLMVIFTRFATCLTNKCGMWSITSSRVGRSSAANGTHAFDLAGTRFSHYGWRDKTWEGGFGRQVLGETWISHHGQHGSQSTRGRLVEDRRDHPILKGIEDGAVWGPTDVYGVRLPLPGDSMVLVLGEVLNGMQPDDEPVAGRQNNPPMPIAWTKSYTGSSGETGRVFTTTMGASQDLQNEALRRLLVNAALWAMDLEDHIADNAKVDLVGEYRPTPFGFGTFQRGVRPASHALGSQETAVGDSATR